MKCDKNADTIFFLLLFTTGQHEKIFKKTFVSAGAQKGEKQQVRGVLYHNIYPILKQNFQSINQSFFFWLTQSYNKVIYNTVT